MHIIDVIITFITSQTVNIILAFFASLSTVITAIIAITAVKSWRRQYIYQRRDDTISEALILAYQAFDVVCSIRNNSDWSSEESPRKRFKNETPKETDLLNDAFIPVERLSRHSELFAKMLAHRYKVMAIFGSDKQDVFQPVLDFRDHIISKSRVAMDFIRGPRSRHRCEEKYLKFKNEYDQLRWEQDGNDAVNQQMQSMIRRLEKLRSKVS